MAMNGPGKKKEAIAEKYKHCKGYEAQRKFRADWCRGLWEKSKTARIKQTTQWKEQINVGEFRPLMVACKEEGGDKEAWDGIKHFIGKIATGDYGPIDQFLHHSEWTHRVEISLLRKNLD